MASGGVEERAVDRSSARFLELHVDDDVVHRARRRRGSTRTGGRLLRRLLLSPQAGKLVPEERIVCTLHWAEEEEKGQHQERRQRKIFGRSTHTAGSSRRHPDAPHTLALLARDRPSRRGGGRRGGRAHRVRIARRTGEGGAGGARASATRRAWRRKRSGQQGDVVRGSVSSSLSKQERKNWGVQLSGRCRGVSGSKNKTGCVVYTRLLCVCVCVCVWSEGGCGRRGLRKQSEVNTYITSHQRGSQQSEGEVEEGIDG